MPIDRLESSGEGNEVFRVATKTGESLIVKQIGPDRYEITGSTVNDNAPKKLGPDPYKPVFVDWGPDVTDLDNGRSDAAMLGGSSEHLRRGDVEITVEEIVAPTRKELIDAFQHIGVEGYDPGDL